MKSHYPTKRKKQKTNAVPFSAIIQCSHFCKLALFAENSHILRHVFYENTISHISQVGKKSTKIFTISFKALVWVVKKRPKNRKIRIIAIVSLAKARISQTETVLYINGPYFNSIAKMPLFPSERMICIPSGRVLLFWNTMFYFLNVRQPKRGVYSENDAKFDPI